MGPLTRAFFFKQTHTACSEFGRLQSYTWIFDCVGSAPQPPSYSRVNCIYFFFKTTWEKKKKTTWEEAVCLPQSFSGHAPAAGHLRLCPRQPWGVMWMRCSHPAARPPPAPASVWNWGLYVAVHSSASFNRKHWSFWRTQRLPSGGGFCDISNLYQNGFPISTATTGLADVLL